MAWSTYIYNCPDVGTLSGNEKLGVAFAPSNAQNTNPNAVVDYQSTQAGVLYAARKGVKCDTLSHSDATATGTAFSSASASFTASDAGKLIEILGAGSAGAAFETTIKSVTNSTTLVLNSAVTTNVTGAVYWYGSDDTGAFNTAISAAESPTQTGGFPLQIQAGTCLISPLNNIISQLCIHGSGEYSTTMMLRAGSNGAVFYFRPSAFTPGAKAGDSSRSEYGNNCVTDLKIESVDGGTASGHTSARGIVLDLGNYCSDPCSFFNHIERVYITNMGGNGLRYLGGFGWSVTQDVDVYRTYDDAFYLNGPLDHTIRNTTLAVSANGNGISCSGCGSVAWYEVNTFTNAGAGLELDTYASIHWVGGEINGGLADGIYVSMNSPVGTPGPVFDGVLIGGNSGANCSTTPTYSDIHFIFGQSTMTIIGARFTAAKGNGGSCSGGAFASLYNVQFGTNNTAQVIMDDTVQFAYGQPSGTDGTIANASTNFSSASAPFASSDVGQSITVYNAGTGNTALVTTIATYTDPSHVILNAAAGTNLCAAGGCTFFFGAPVYGYQDTIDSPFVTNQPGQITFGSQRRNQPVNLLCGGDFSANNNPWQAGTSFTGITSTPTDGPDCWFAWGTVSNSITFAQQSGGPTGFSHYLQMIETSSDSSHGINMASIVLPAVAQTIQGGAVTCGGYIKTDGASGPTRLTAYAVWGTGNDANTTKAGLQNQTWTNYNASGQFNWTGISSSWHYFYATFLIPITQGGSAVRQFALQIGWTPNGTANTGFDFDGMGCYVSGRMVVFVHPHPTDTLKQAQERYQVSYDPGTAPGAVTATGATAWLTSYASWSTGGVLTVGNWGGPVFFRETMWKAPSITMYSTDGTSGKMRDTANAANVTPTVANIGRNGFQWEATPNVATNPAIGLQGQWVADARP